MTRFAAWVALATVAAVVVGCGPGKELPAEIPKTEPGEKPIAVPTASEPKAKEFVETAVKAFTGGKPELVAKGLASRVTFKGTMALPVENELLPLPAVRTIAAVWPDRIFTTNEVDFRGQTMRVRTWLRGSEFTTFEGSIEQDRGNRAELIKSFPTDVAGQYWMALLAPLTDPKAVVFDFQLPTAPAPPTGPRPVKLLKLAVADFPLFQLAFDAKTDLLVRVEYAVVEQGTRRRKQWLALEHKPGPDGLMLPSKTECRHDGALVEQWELDKWEFPAKIDDTEFHPPKK